MTWKFNGNCLLNHMTYNKKTWDIVSNWQTYKIYWNSWLFCWLNTFGKDMHECIWLIPLVACILTNLAVKHPKHPSWTLLCETLRFWCITRLVHISVAHVTGKVNSEADEESCKENDDTEWSLHDDTLKTIHEMHKEISDDLFTSHLNHKLSLQWN